MQPALFRKLSLFAELDDRELASIAGVAKTRRYNKDDVIFHADESGDVFCVIREGKVKITMISPEGKEIILSMMGPGEFFRRDGAARRRAALRRRSSPWSRWKSSRSGAPTSSRS